MSSPPSPPALPDPDDERHRLDALQAYDLLDTAPDQALDQLVALAGEVFGAASAAVSLIDTDRQWFKARHGIAVSQTGLDESLCAIAIREPDGLLVIPDARNDPRVADHQAVVGPLQIGFYAGAVLQSSDGARLGALCVFDGTPRAPSAEQLRTLQLLAREVMARLDLHRELQRRVKAEQRLAEAQRLAQLGSWELDLGTGALWWSDEVFRQFGIAPSAFGATYEAFVATVHPDDREVLEAAQARALNGEAPLNLVHRIVRPDGSVRVVHERGELLRDRRGQPTRLVGTVQDVTAEHETREALRTLNAQLGAQAALLELARDAILVHELDGQVTFWNGGAERTFGWSAEHALGQTVATLLGLRDDAHRSGMAAVLADGAWRGELQGRTRAGDDLVLECSKTMLRDDLGQPHAVLAILSDVTSQRKLEAQLLRAQRMESIGTLAGGIAHDLNNMLAPIVMSIQLLAEEVRSDEGREMLRTIENSAKRGADLVRQVLSFARGVEGERVSVLLEDVMRDVERLLRDTLPRQIRVYFDVPTSLPTVTGDATQLHQVLLNLCVNARDAMPSGGTLQVSARTVRLDAQYAAMAPSSTEGPFVCLEVMDSGVGIPAELLDRIFDPFFTTKPLGEGTGLGLATVQAIARSHGGFVNVYSESGMGTTFRVYLPAAGVRTTASAVSEPPPLDHGLPRGRGELVLVVDDEAAILAITRQTLQAYGYRVLTASDGVEALAVFRQHGGTIQLVLTDMMMPRMDGPTLIQYLLAANADLPIVAASGLGANGGVAKAKGHGVTHFLPKPYTAEVLLRKLDDVLHHP